MSQQNKSDELRFSDVNWLRFSIYSIIALYSLYFYIRYFPAWRFSTYMVFLFLGMSVSTFSHRYFAHRSYEMNRFFQFVFAVLTNLTLQKDPIWWASMHRKHHMYADTKDDPHSPVVNSPFHVFFLWAFLKKNEKAEYSLVKDLMLYSDLRWLNRNPYILPSLFALTVFGFSFYSNMRLNPDAGVYQWVFLPEYGALDSLVAAYLLPMTAVFWYTGLTNYLGHMVGSKRYPMPNNSGNSMAHAFISVGEGWHNNHHYHPYSANFSYRWWHLDIGYYYIQILQILRIAKNVKIYRPKDV